MHWTLTLSQDLQVFMSQCTPPPSLLLLPCPYLSIGLGYLGWVKNQMQNTGEPMPKFFTGLDIFFLWVNYKGARKIHKTPPVYTQISGEPMPNFTLLFNVQSQAPPTLLFVLAKLMYVLVDRVHRQFDRCLSEILGVIFYFNKSLPPGEQLSET